MLRKLILSGFVFCLIFVLSGCGDSSRPKDLPDLQPCTLTITQDNQGLADAFVMFYTVDPNSTKWVIAGNTDANGKVVPKTHGKFSGVPVGEYKIVVTKTEQVEVGAVQQTSGDTTNTPPQKVDIYYLIDKMYTDVLTTPLTITIKNGKNVQTFDVGKPVREKSKIIVL
ncbi:MAG: hypothetical protein LBP87_13970 [Planctomycetaceae bacterium]|jgi:hypothetical protein|nr:hypothetical protein [Planctomycetaceae bacterium]